LRASMKKAMVHVSRMVKSSLGVSNNMYHLIGIDFMLDDDLKLWFIEANVKPSIQGVNPERERFMVKMLIDHYEVMYGYLRSRMKRVINYVNDLTNTYSTREIFQLEELPDYQRIQKSFDKLNRNKMEPEYEIGARNGFHKIVDLNFDGVDAYMGIIPKECL